MCIVQISANSYAIQTAHTFLDIHSALHSLNACKPWLFDNCLRTTLADAIVTIETKSTNNSNNDINIAMTSIQCHQDGAYTVVWSRFNMNLSMSFMFEWVSFTDIPFTHSLCFPWNFNICINAAAAAVHKIIIIIILIFNSIVIINCYVHCCTVQAFTRLNSVPKWMNIEMLSRACISICIPTVSEYVPLYNK